MGGSWLLHFTTCYHSHSDAREDYLNICSWHACQMMITSPYSSNKCDEEDLLKNLGLANHPPSPPIHPDHFSSSAGFSLSSLYFWHLPHLLSQIQVKKIWALPFTDICWLSCNLQEANFDAIPVTFLGCISRFTFWQLQRPSQWIPIFSKKDITASNLFLLVIFLIWIVVGHLGLEYHLNRVPFPNAILHLKPKLSEKDGYRIMYKS